MMAAQTRIKELSEIMVVLRTATENICAKEITDYYKAWLANEKAAGNITEKDYNAALVFLTMSK